MTERANAPGPGSSLIVAERGAGPRKIASARRALPEQWTQVHVMDRLEEAYEILARLPMNTRPKGYGNAMPVYVYDRGDLNAQVETGELERLMKVQNRIRISPSADQVARMEEALAWPLTLLRDMPEIARAVQLGSLWAAMRLDQARACKRAGINRKFFNRQKMHGLTVIAMRLIVRKVAVR